MPLTFTVTLGWWLLPLLLTAMIALNCRRLCARDCGPGLGPDVAGLFHVGFAIILTLVVWVVYLLFALWS